MDNGMEVFQKTKNRTTIRSRNSTTEYISEENKSKPQEDIISHLSERLSFKRQGITSFGMDVEKREP